MEPLPDETDAKSFDFFRRKSKTNTNNNSSSEPEKLPTGPDIWAEEYDMSHSKRGLALVFNHHIFLNGQSSRLGAERDATVIREQFEVLQFDVKIYTNKTKKEILALLDGVAADTNNDIDCLVVFVMTHGDPNELSAYDTTYKSSKLWEAFTADKCKSLVGKPKLFFIQACRGKNVDAGVQLAAGDFRSRAGTQTDASPRVTYTIPTMADILIANATFDGHVAWRNADSGSWFIQALCAELEKSGQTKEICQILTRVNRRVAIHYSSYVPNDKAQHQKKQMPNFMSTLTRDLYFRRKP